MLRPHRELTAIGVLAAAVLTVSCDRGPAAEVARLATPSPTPSPSPPPDYSAFIASVDALAAEALQRGPVAGLSIAVVEHGKAILEKGYGYADQEAGVLATPQTSDPIASLSQHHTSGLTRGGPAPRAAALSVITRGGTARAQGEDWEYSNYNYSLLGLVIEQASGRDYSRFVHDEIVVPLGLTGTGYCEDGTAVPGRGLDYQSGVKTVSPTPYWTEQKFFAAGGLCSTVLDLVRWEKALEEGRVISPPMLQAMRAPARLPSGLQADYGYGTRLGITGSHHKLGHTGGGQSNKAVLARYPDDEVTVAVLRSEEHTNAHVTAT